MAGAPYVWVSDVTRDGGVGVVDGGKSGKQRRRRSARGKGHSARGPQQVRQSVAVSESKGEPVFVREVLEGGVESAQREDLHSGSSIEYIAWDLEM